MDRRDEPFSREVRLGLVLYGGVSLAIYINGVTTEFFRAVRGKGVFSLVKALTDSKVVVDVISGTSAGGVNGIFLAYALCNERNFEQFASLWREHGDIARLLRRPTDSEDGAFSLLDSEEYYQSRLEDAFRGLDKLTPPVEGEIVSPFPELDLFITGTDVYGRISDEIDDAGHHISVKDHRAVFHLKHRAGRKEPFNSKHPDNAVVDPEITFCALAKLSRITSCFPAAFSPVFVENAPPGHDSPDAKLQLWGRIGRKAYFLDGGILDNKPFSHTIREIFNRTADCSVSRILFYVEPDPERFEPNVAPEQPTIFQTISDSLTGIPGYESIADDLRMLREHNDKVELYNRLSGNLSHANGVPEPDSTTRELYQRSCVTALAERALTGVLTENGRCHLEDDENKEAAASQLKRAFDVFLQQDFANEQLLLVLGDFDVYRRLRRMFHLTYVAQEIMATESDASSPGTAEVSNVVRLINRQVHVLEVLRYQMERQIDGTRFAWVDVARNNTGLILAEKIWAQIEDLLWRTLTDQQDPELPDGWEQDADLLSDVLHKRPVLPVRDPPSDRPAGWRGLLQATDLRESTMLNDLPAGRIRNALVTAYDNFDRLDAHLYPMQLMAGLEERDVIRTVRISPQDAQRGFSKRECSAKLSGDAVHHFGGFFKRSWRSNDILWGRLDGLCQLLEELLQEDRVRALVSNPGSLGRLRRRMGYEEQDGGAPVLTLEALQPETLFPNCGPALCSKLSKWLLDLLGNDPASREAAIENLPNYRDLLTEAAQFELLREQVPLVLRDALFEQASWNQFRISLHAAEEAQNLKVHAGLMAFVPGAATFDPYVLPMFAEAAANYAIQALSTEQISVTDLKETKLGQHFLHDYHVGTESILDAMPRSVLMRIFSTALLVARDCVLTALGDRGRELRANVLQRFMVEMPLKGFHAYVGWWQRSPADERYRRLAVVVIALLLLTIGVVWRAEILYSGDEFHLRWAVLFIGMPVLVLGLNAASGIDGVTGRSGWRFLRYFPIVLLCMTGLGGVFWFLADGRLKWVDFSTVLFVIALCIFPLVGGWLFSRLGRTRLTSWGDLEGAVNHFGEKEVYRLASRLGIDGRRLRQEKEMTPEELKALILQRHKTTSRRKRLETAIRAIDPEALPNLPGSECEDMLLRLMSIETLRCIANTVGVSVPGELEGPPNDKISIQDIRKGLVNTIMAFARENHKQGRVEALAYKCAGNPNLPL